MVMIVMVMVMLSLALVVLCLVCLTLTLILVLTPGTISGVPQHAGNILYISQRMLILYILWPYILSNYFQREFLQATDYRLSVL